MVEYKQTKAATDKFRQRANRKRWSTFRAQFGLPELASYSSNYNLTVPQAQAEAATLGIVQTVTQPFPVQSASAMPIASAKISAKPKKRKQVDFEDDNDEDDDEGEEIDDADFVPLATVPEKKAKRKPALTRIATSGGAVKKMKVGTGREEEDGFSDNAFQINEEASTHNHDPTSSVPDPRNSNNKQAMASPRLIKKKDPMAKINMVAEVLRSAEDWEIAEIVQGIIDNPDQRKIVSRLMHHKYEDMREAARESGDYVSKQTNRGEKAPSPRFQEEVTMDLTHDNQSNSGWKVERSGIGKLFDAIDKRAAAEAEKAQHFRDMYENAVYGVE